MQENSSGCFFSKHSHSVLVGMICINGNQIGTLLDRSQFHNVTKISLYALLKFCMRILHKMKLNFNVIFVS